MKKGRSIMADLIDREAAIDKYGDWYVEEGTEEGFISDMRHFFEMLPSAEPQWIPCSERLPEEDCETGKGVQYSDFVLMSVEHKEDEETIVDYGHTVDGKWYSDYTDCFIPQEWKVIAWMPLPEPYEVKDE